MFLNEGRSDRFTAGFRFRLGVEVFTPQNPGLPGDRVARSKRGETQQQKQRRPEMRAY